MWRVAIAVSLAGCGFTAGTSTDDGNHGAADGAVDTGIDAPKLCNVTPALAGMPTPSSLGEQPVPPPTHGSPLPPAACPAGQVPVGIGFTSTTNAEPEGGVSPGERIVT